MNERTLRPANIAAAAALIGGLLAVAQPHHAAGIFALVILTIATAAGLRVVISNAPPAWWISPFSRPAQAGAPTERSDEQSRLRSVLSGRRQRVPGGPPLPPGVLRRLQPLLRSALEREGLDPGDASFEAAALERLTPLSWAVLTCRIEEPPRWWRTLQPDPDATAAAVHRVLDDVASLENLKQPTIPARGVS